MTRIMMMPGRPPFLLETAAFQSLTRTPAWRRQGARATPSAKPAGHYPGPGPDEIGLSGDILPQRKGGWNRIEARRAGAMRAGAMR